MPNLYSDELGVTRSKQPVTRYTLSNDRGLTLQCLSLGAIISTLTVPDSRGRPGDVVLGFDTLAEYEAQTAYLGAVVGRYANRIADGRFELDGSSHDITRNEGRHHLHGGHRGFDKQLWDAVAIESTREMGVRFSRRSEDGEEGYPGALDVTVTYLLRDDTVVIEFFASATRSTIVNLTQHAYFDLSAGAATTVHDHRLTIESDAILDVDRDLIPTGRLLPVADTPFDFRTPRAIGERVDAGDRLLGYGGGYDHTWVLDVGRGGNRPAATLEDPASGRRLDIRTTEPGLQCYTGNRLNNVPGKGGRRYRARGGVCLESQHFPNSPAHAHFPSTVLRPGEAFRSTTTWTFSAADASPVR